ncbi:hypothetical protein HDU77_006825 [Chytriomyces hyalinus]|nr:hypothetical protein HDU77_006825 [Chytriomyces hyalinus]
MNQYEQVIFIKALITNSPDELKTHTEKILLHCYHAQKFKFPVLIHTDNYCNDHDMVHQVLQSLSDINSMFTTQLADASPNTFQPLPDMELPDTQLVHHVTKYKLDGNDNGLKIICEVLRKNGAILLDIEYNNGKKIQALPKDLKELLYDTQLVFVGNFIQVDLTRLSKHYSLDQNRISNWEGSSSQEQIQDAALDTVY